MSDTTTEPVVVPAPDDASGIGVGVTSSDGEMQDGDFGLGGDLAAQVEQALKERWADKPDKPEGDAAVTTDDTIDTGTAAGDDQPAPTTSADAQSAEGAGATGGALEGAAPVDGAPPAPVAPDEPFSLDKYAEDYFGTKLTAEQSRELFGVLGGLQNLTPEKRAYLDAVLSNPGAPLPTLQTADQRPSPVVTGEAYVPPVAPLTTLPPRPTDDFPEDQRFYDTYFAPLAAQQQAIQDQLASTTQQQVARQVQETSAAIDVAATAWRASHPDVTDGEYDALVDRFVQQGTIEAIARARGSYALATSEGLDQLYWSDPALRTRALANVASGRVTGDATSIDPASSVAQQQQAADRERQARASAVAGGGGGVVTRGDQSIPKTPEGAKAAMVAEIAGAWEG